MDTLPPLPRAAAMDRREFGRVVRGALAGAALGETALGRPARAAAVPARPPTRPPMSAAPARPFEARSFEPRPFRHEWPAAAVERVRAQVRGYRPPGDPGGAPWQYGVDPAFLQGLCAYWADGYDAGAALGTLNRFPQHLVRVEDLDLHVVHVVGEARGRRPLLVSHGWPSSVYEFWDVVEPLAYPSRFGGRPEDAFDLVIPSLPGFGPSGKPAPPIGARTMARLFDALMRDGFGYARYAAHGGDVGAFVTAWLGLEHAGSLRGIHLSSLGVQPDVNPQTPEEQRWKTERDAREQALGAYLALQSTKPRSLAYAMVDNPVAQAAWIIERLHDWSDRRDRPFEAVFSRDWLLTTVMLYVMNDAFVSSSWSYPGETVEHARQMPAGRRVEVPTAYAAYPDPRSPVPPRSWVEQGYAVARWSTPPRGGHFAAAEVPDLFVDDLRAWGREVDWR